MARMSESSVFLTPQQNKWSDSHEQESSSISPVWLLQLLSYDAFQDMF